MTEPIAGHDTAVLAVLLAAGFGRRFDDSGQTNKLLAPLNGRTVAELTAAELISAGFSVIAVARPESVELQEKLVAMGCTIVTSERAKLGMGYSIADAVAHLLASSTRASGVLICLADMPFIQSSIYRQVSEALSANHSTAAAAYAGKRGHPVAFSHQHFEALAKLSGDAGAGKILRTHPPLLVETHDRSVLQDIDRPTDLPGQ